MTILVIGFGNPSRRDDRVGLAVVNGLRRRLGLPLLDDNDDGYNDLGRVDPARRIDTLFLQQLMPELGETISRYDRVFFVDAHVGTLPELIRWAPVTLSGDRAIVSHHVKPAGLLYIAERLYGHAPQAELISIRGFDFDFGTELSPQTAEAVDQVVDQLWQRLQPA